MMDFISIPLVVGIVFFGTYKLFELFVRRRERLSIIEKMGEKFDPTMVDNKFSFPDNGGERNKYFSLKLACLLLGVGLGLLVGFAISQYTLVGIDQNSLYQNIWDVAGVVYGASTLLCGGLGLLIAFLIEMKMRRKAE